MVAGTGFSDSQPDAAGHRAAVFAENLAAEINTTHRNIKLKQRCKVAKCIASAGKPNWLDICAGYFCHIRCTAVRDWVHAVCGAIRIAISVHFKAVLNASWRLAQYAAPPRPRRHYYGRHDDSPADPTANRECLGRIDRPMAMDNCPSSMAFSSFCLACVVN